MTKPRLALTMGDPAGVGPELCLILLARAGEVLPPCVLTIYGDLEVLNRVAGITGLPAPDPQCVQSFATSAFEPAQVSAACGQASANFLESAVRATLKGEQDAIVTCPINKASLHAAGINFPGHTEILAMRTGSKRSCMLQYSKEVTASFVTCHCGYSEVAKLLTSERLREVIDLTNEAISKLKGVPARLVTLGLNPHAGEGGLFGDREEERIIIPEIEAARERGIDIHGPVPPDTAFLPNTRKTTDAFICMYHDQGHIPLKALAFDNAVNVTLGLPIVRTSVDHGTAFDIAWQGVANPGSLIEAAKLAIQLSADR